MKRYRKLSRRKRFKLILLQLLLFCILIACGLKLLRMVHAYDMETEDLTPSIFHGTEAAAAKNTTTPIQLDAKELVSSNAKLVRLSDHKVLFDKNSEDIIYPASLTKIMTAIVAIEHLTNLNQTIELSSDMFQTLYKEDASLAGFLPGETVRAIDLLYGVLLPSGAECCIGLSEYIAGSEDNFVALMNEKAKNLEMNQTHFVNSTGLNDPDHYTTVSDLVKLLEYALDNDTFRDIFTSSRHSTDTTSLHPDGITFNSTLFKNIDSPDFKDGSILGGKTGYTSEAGLCLASLAAKDNTEYILVTAGAKGDHNTEQYNITDALYAYENLP